MAAAAGLAALAGAGISILPADNNLLMLLLSASGIFVVATGSIVAAHRANFDVFQPLGLVSAFYVLGFAAGGLYFWYAPYATYRGFTPGAIGSASGLAVLGLVAFVAGYRFKPLTEPLSHVTKPRIPFVPSSQEATPFGFFIILLGVGWLARLQTVASGFYFHFNPTGAIVGNTSSGFLVDTLSKLPTVAVAYLIARAYLGGSPGTAWRSLPVSAVILLVLEFAWVVPSGSRGQALGLVLMIFILRYYGRHRIPSLGLSTASVLIAVFVVFPLVLNYRSGTGADYQGNVSESLGTSVNDYASQTWTERLDNGLDATFTRFSDITGVAAVIEDGREPSGLSAGESYGWALPALVPRALAPTKNDPGFFGNDFARNYGFVRPGDRLTAIAPTQLGELLLNFGLLGVFGMVAYGMLFRLLSELTAARKTDPLALALYSVLAWPLINGLEGIFVGAFLGLIKAGAVLAVVSIGAMWVAGGRTATPKPAQAAIPQPA